jgi:carboxyl-terminal processing protease
MPKTPENPGAVKLTIRKFYRPSGSSTQLRGVVPDIVLPSPNNYAEVGEGSLDNPLQWDTIQSAPFKKLNLIQPILPELQKRSLARLDKDQDFIYLREDIEQYRKVLADKSVSLNEAQRLKEKQELEARQKTRQAELKSRPENNEQVYDLTLKQADVPGLPAPMGKTNEVASSKGPHVTSAASDLAAAGEPAKIDDTKPNASKDEDDEDSASESKVPPVDASLKEAKRILVDLIALWPPTHSVAAAATN